MGLNTYSKLCAMYGKLVCQIALGGILLATILPSSATPVFVNETLNDLDITVESSLVGQRGMAFVQNNESEAIMCDVTFKNGPELPVKRRSSVNPGVKKIVETTFGRKIVKLTIDVVCNKK
mgnify:FL=1